MLMLTRFSPSRNTPNSETPSGETATSEPCAQTPPGTQNTASEGLADHDACAPRSLARPKRWKAKLRRLREGRRKYSLGAATITSGLPVGTFAQVIWEIERAEEGKANARFRSTVATVVDIQEEGLFRHIITFL